MTFCSVFFFFNDTATTEIYTLSLHDALPILTPRPRCSTSSSSLEGTSMAPTGTPRDSTSADVWRSGRAPPRRSPMWLLRDRKSTRLNSSHANISYAVFCLKKKKHTHILEYAP